MCSNSSVWHGSGPRLCSRRSVSYPLGSVTMCAKRCMMGIKASGRSLCKGNSYSIGKSLSKTMSRGMRKISSLAQNLKGRVTADRWALR